MKQKRSPMIPHIRWALVYPDGTWALGPMTYEFKRIAVEVRDRTYRPGHGIDVQRVRITPVRRPVRKAKR